MNLQEATAIAVAMIRDDLDMVGLAGVVDQTSPDGDFGKFSLWGLPARVIPQRDGFYINVNLNWFHGADSPAWISGGPIYFYVFVFNGPHARYWICDWRTMRQFVLDFNEATLPHYQVTLRWRLALDAIKGAPDAALFRWGDERADQQLLKPTRIIDLGNCVTTVGVEREREGHDRGRAVGGEGQAHKLLKLYLANHRELVGVSPRATVHVEYQFPTGDRVDVLFRNHDPERTVVEIEVEGRKNLLVGVQQAVKYAALAGVEGRYPVVSPRVRPFVVAYRVDYPEVIELADRYGVRLLAVDPCLEVAA